MGRQTWQFTAITDRAKIQKLAKAVATALGLDSGYTMYNPAVLIITSNDKDSRFREVDNACAMDNIYLASEALGLGCVWINQVNDCFDNAGVRAVLKEFGVPDNGHYASGKAPYPNVAPNDDINAGSGTLQHRASFPVHKNAGVLVISAEHHVVYYVHSGNESHAEPVFRYKTHADTKLFDCKRRKSRKLCTHKLNRAGIHTAQPGNSLTKLFLTGTGNSRHAQNLAAMNGKTHVVK